MRLISVNGVVGARLQWAEKGVEVGAMVVDASFKELAIRGWKWNCAKNVLHCLGWTYLDKLRELKERRGKVLYQLS